MKSIRFASMLLGLLVLQVIGSITVTAATVNKILDNGPDGQKLVFVVIGDGYAATEQQKYANDVNNLVINGVLTHDFYRDNSRAFNIYRVDLVSNTSGVSGVGAIKDTALQTVYNGIWNQCWIEESARTNTLINSTLSPIAKYDYVMIIQNESRYGGCRRGNRLYVTNGVGWDVVAHEYGHGIGGLLDEYTHPSKPRYQGLEYGPHVNFRNCTTVLDAATVSWARFIANPTLITPLPTVFNGERMDPNGTVGLFEGCGTYVRGLYRPVDNCRMNTNSPQFCPVCSAFMSRSVARYLGNGPVAALYNHARAHQAQDPPHPTGAYMHIVMKVKKDGAPEIISMTPVEGTLPPRDESASSFALSVIENNRLASVEFLPDDPFLIRGFEDPQNRRGEFYKSADSAVIVVDIPNEFSELASGKVSLELNRLKEVAAANTQQPVPETVLIQQLKNENKLTREFQLSAGRLKTAARDQSKVKSMP